MAALNLVITNAGRAAIINAENSGTAPVVVAQLGLSNTAVVAAPGAVALPGEFKRVATIAGGVVADDTIHLTARDESADNYTFRSIALYLNDGTMLAHYGQADPILTKVPASIMLLSVDIKLADVNAASITFGDTDFINPPATTETKGVVELATDTEVAAKIDSTRAVTAKSLWFAFSAWVAAAFSDVWRASNDGAGSGLDADLWRGLPPTAFVRGDVTGNPARGQSVILASNTADLGIAGAPLQLRELNYAGAQDGALNKGPAIAFHWQGQYAASIRMAANGHFHFVDGVGAYRDLIAYNLQALGGAATVWHSGNDGAGSGADAGLLAGQLPGFYTDIPGRQGYPSANKAGDTFLGNVLAPNFFSPGIISTGGSLYNIGGIALHSADATHSGFLSFTDKNGVRAGYVGYASGTTIDIVADGAYVYNWNKAFTIAGNQVWHAGNDGAGSGADAGLLAGQLPSFYTDIAGRQGYTSLNKAGDTMTGALYINDANFLLALSTGTPFIVLDNTDSISYDRAADALNVNIGNVIRLQVTNSGLSWSSNTVWHAGNDGAGSGMDAGLFAGQLPSYYTNITYHLGYTPLNQASYTAADVLAKLLTVDGSGSGIDADFWRGHAPSDFVLAGSASRWGNAAAGGRRSSDGDVTQWKQGSWDPGGPEASPQTIYYPVPFDIECDDVQVTTLLSSNNSLTDSIYQLISFDYEKCVVVKQRTTGNDSVAIAPRIRAVGR